MGMKENKRFTVHIKWYNYDKTEGEIELFDNGQPLLVSECIEDVRMVKGLLNELAEENQALKERRHEDINELAVIAIKYKATEKETEEVKQLLEEIRHEMVSIDGLTAFDKCSSQLGYVEVFDDDRIELDYKELLKKIDKVI